MEPLNIIQNIFNNLNEHQRFKLNYAHRIGITKYVIYNDNQFIGVHCEGVPNLIIESSYNDWCVGFIRQEMGHNITHSYPTMEPVVLKNSGE